uniref:DUF1672 family protein n=1 Tax=Listeria valentina TaxID=2705293 RepID=UPI001431BB48
IQFHTSVIVGFDMQKKELDPLPNVRSEEWKVESGIISGLYVKAYEEEFKRLDIFTQKEAEKYNLQGLNQATIDKTQSAGYEKAYYFVPLGGDYKAVYDAYIKNQNISATEIRNLFLKENSEIKYQDIGIHYFNTQEGLPKQEIADRIAENLKNEKGLPKGNYSVSIFKDFIVDRVGQPDGENVSVDDIPKIN